MKEDLEALRYEKGEKAKIFEDIKYIGSGCFGVVISIK